jgi:hypothetical protein
MIPDKPGIYWVRLYGFIDDGYRFGVGKWVVARYDDEGWMFIGTEDGLDSHEEVVEIGPEILPPG